VNLLSLTGLALLCALMPAQAGTINVLSDNRSVDTRATAGSLNGSVTQPDAKTAAPFQTFAELASSSVAWPDPVNPIFSNNASAAARQTSALLENGFSLTSTLAASAIGSALQTPKSQAKATATSQVDLTFSVSEPLMFDLMYSESHESNLGDAGLYQASGFLNSDREGRICSVPPSGSLLPVFSGMLVPGEIYTLSYFQRVGLFQPNPVGDTMTANSTLRLEVRDVPDQAGIFSFAMACACLGTTRFFLRRGQSLQATTS